MDFSWKAAAAAVLAGTALGLSGCVAFDGPIKGKQISDDQVKVKFTICDDIETECNDEPMARQRGTNEVHLLIGIRAPKGTDVPKDFSPKGIDVLFSGSESYTAEMNTKAPHKASEKWFGYISEDIDARPENTAKIKLVLGLPHNPGNSFKYRPVVGYVNGPPSDTVVCAENVQDSNQVESTDTVCVDDPGTPEELAKSLKIDLD
jgi:hypothetical protein